MSASTKFIFRLMPYSSLLNAKKLFKLSMFALSVVGLIASGISSAQESNGCLEDNSSFHLNARVRAETLDVDRYGAIVKPSVRGECGQIRFQVEADIQHSSETKDEAFGTYREYTALNLGNSFIEYGGSNFTIGVGNRGRYWGALRGLTLVDFITPVVLEEYGTIDFSHTVAYQPQVYFDTVISDWLSLESYVVIEPRVAAYGLDQELTAVGIIDRELPDERNQATEYKSVSDTFEAGVKIKFEHGGWNSALIGFTGEQDTFFKAKMPNDENDHLHGIADERGMVALNTSKQFKDFKLRAETAYWPEHLNIRPHHRGGLEFVEGEVWGTAVGLDHKINDASVSWQFLNISRWSDPGDYEESSQRVTLLVTHAFSEGRIELLGYAAYEIETNDSWTNATLNYMVSDRVTLELGVKTFSGSTFSFGGLIETDHAYISTKFNF